MATYFLRRRTLLAGLAVLALSACGDSGDAGGSAGTVGELTDMSIGAANAPVTLVEYASITCGACAQFHRDVVPTVKEMVEDGRVRFVFREYPTGPVEVAIAGFALARCAGEGEVYFDVLEDIFTNQQNILAAARNRTVRTALEAVGARHGVDTAEFDACLSNNDIRTAISNATNQGTADGVTGTPTLFLNGRLLNASEGRTAQSITELVDAIAPKPE